MEATPFVYVTVLIKLFLLEGDFLYEFKLSFSIFLREMLLISGNSKVLLLYWFIILFYSDVPPSLSTIYSSFSEYIFDESVCKIWLSLSLAYAIVSSNLFISSKH